MASRSVSRGLAAVEPEAGTLVVYAAKDGETALDGDGISSPFASAFVKNVPRPGLEVRRLFDFVRDESLRRPIANKSLSATVRSLVGRISISWRASKYAARRVRPYRR